MITAKVFSGRDLIGYAALSLEQISEGILRGYLGTLDAFTQVKRFQNDFLSPQNRVLQGESIYPNIQVENGCFITGGQTRIFYKTDYELCLVRENIDSYLLEESLTNLSFFLDPWRPLSIEEKHSIESKIFHFHNSIDSLLYKDEYRHISDQLSQKTYVAICMNKLTQEFLFKEISNLSITRFVVVNFKPNSTDSAPELNFYSTFSEFRAQKMKPDMLASLSL